MLKVAARQGVNKVKAGITRCLTVHELARGYVFITLDRALPEILNVNDFTAVVNGTEVLHKRISVSGRVHLPRVLLEDIGTQEPVKIQVMSKEILKIASYE